MGMINEGYKQTEIGAIPEEWELKVLDELANITRLAGAEYSDLWQVDDDGEIIALRGFNIGSNRLNLDNVDRISSKLSQRLIRSKLFKDDIVFPCVGTIGKAYRVLEDNKFHINQNIAKITPNKQIDSEYLTHYLLSPFTTKQIMKYNTSSSQPNVLVGNLRRFNIIVPLITEQKKIAEILSTTDEHIEKLDKTIEDYKLLKKGMMKKLLTEGIGHTEFKETEIGRIPKEWEVKALSKTVENTQLGLNEKSSESNDGIPLIKMGNLTKGGFDFSKLEKVSDRNLENYSDFILKHGDFLFNTRNTPELVGKSATWRNHIQDAIFNSNIMRITFKEFINTFWLGYYFASNNGWKSLKRISTGTTSVGAIYTKDLLKVKIPVPPLQEQQCIASLLSEFDTTINLYQKEREDFVQLKKALMEQLLTGKIRINQ